MSRLTLESRGLQCSQGRCGQAFAPAKTMKCRSVIAALWAGLKAGHSPPLTCSSSTRSVQLESAATDSARRVREHCLSRRLVWRSTRDRTGFSNIRSVCSNGTTDRLRTLWPPLRHRLQTLINLVEKCSRDPSGTSATRVLHFDIVESSGASRAQRPDFARLGAQESECE